jgi:glucose-6-phosphate 1-dehydrogenase
VSRRRIEPGDRPRQPPDCAMVVFGASGDLTRRKLVPALYYLAKAALLPARFVVLGVASTAMSSEAWRAKLEREIGDFLEEERADAEVWGRLEERLYYLPGGFEDAAVYERLRAQLDELAERHRTGKSVLFYLATPPEFFASIAERLGAAGLLREEPGTFRRLIVEKPFGRDLESALELDSRLRAVLAEPQILRIDHYLGKETVQNLLVFRFANGIFEPIWNRRYVDHVQITVSETVGVEQRGPYYDRIGALRDMVPNHLFQLLALVAMEPPNSIAGEAVRDEKAKVLEALQPFDPEDVLARTVRGQYGGGAPAGGEVAAAYRQEPRVAGDSRTETYVALKLLIDSWRWAGVPFYLRTGKRLRHRLTEIAVEFKCPPLVLFRGTANRRLTPNLLVVNVQPDEGISLRFNAKVPGPEIELGAVDMDFDYQDYFGQTPSTGYETLLYDAMTGDPTLFQRSDAVAAGWRALQPVLDVWSALPPRGFPNYPAGGDGPAEADELLERDGRRWRPLDGE